MRGTGVEKRSERLVARIHPEDKALLEKAAELEGRSLASFVVTHLCDYSRKVIEEHSRIDLNHEESLRLIRALQDPPRQPAAAMKRAVREYRESVTEH